jgi:DNA-directed RNA polymerase subunit RPC12/RpoP
MKVLGERTPRSLSPFTFTRFPKIFVERPVYPTKRTHLPSKQTEKNNNMSHACSSCGKAFTSLGGLKYHTNNNVCKNKEEISFTCSSCGKAFTSLVGLKYHTTNNVCNKNKSNNDAYQWRSTGHPFLQKRVARSFFDNSEWGAVDGHSDC